MPAPIERYDTLHAELVKRTTGPVEGLPVHLGRATATGFQELEIWESKAHDQRYDAEVVQPAMGELTGGAPPPQPPRIEEFEVRGLVIPQGDVLV